MVRAEQELLYLALVHAERLKFSVWQCLRACPPMLCCRLGCVRRILPCRWLLSFGLLLIHHMVVFKRLVISMLVGSLVGLEVRFSLLA